MDRDSRILLAAEQMEMDGGISCEDAFAYAVHCEEMADEQRRAAAVREEMELLFG